MNQLRLDDHYYDELLKELSLNTNKSYQTTYFRIKYGNTYLKSNGKDLWKSKNAARGALTLLLFYLLNTVYDYKGVDLEEQKIMGDRLIKEGVVEIVAVTV